jgi:tetratricopeptide (TPR) repeat protein
VAYEAYLLGRARLARRNTDAVADALRHFERAIEADPGYALAHVGRAHATIALGVFGLLETRTAERQATEALERALALDPLLGDVYAVRGLLHMNAGDAKGAAESFQRAIDLAPSHAEAHTWYMGILMEEGRFAEAERFGRRAVELDPLAPIVQLRMGYLTQMQRPEEALPFFLRAIEVEPLFASGYSVIGAHLGDVEGRIAEGIRWMRRAAVLDPAGGLARSDVFRFYVDIGDDAQAGRILAAAQRAAPGHPEVIGNGVIYALITNDLPEIERLTAALSAGQGGAASWGLTEAAWRTDGPSGALQALEKHHPELLKAAPETIRTADFLEGVQLAGALIQTGNTARGTAIAERVLTGLRTTWIPGWSAWLEVAALEVLGRTDEADAALRRKLSAGVRTNWRYLQEASELASLRTRPAYRQAVAELEAWAAAARADLVRKPELTDEDIRRAIATGSIQSDAG